MATNPDFMMNVTGDSIAARFRAVRAFTEALTETLETEDFVIQTMPDVSPTKWHLAHVSWFFENFLLRPNLPGYRDFNESFSFLFNSYYYQVGQMHARPERGLLTRPTVDEVFAYRAHVDEHMHTLIEQHGDDADVMALVELGINHEQQHQELLLTDIKHVFSKNPLQPAFHELPQSHGQVKGPVNGKAPELRFIEGPSDRVTIGFEAKGFAYDNEGPAHDVILQPYEIANRPVTNREFAEFIADGGYERSEYWLSEGWATVNERGWRRPFYWLDDRHEFSLGGLREMHPDEPVSHLSYFEADAFASWAGARLPSEAEWEAWARRYPIHGNFADSRRFHPAPPAADEDAVQVFGDVWEWTRSAYSPYPGYRPAAGAVGEYNGKFMLGQMVLRGGSCATSLSHIRPTYRNFFYPADQWQFTGARLAKDL